VRSAGCKPERNKEQKYRTTHADDPMKSLLQGPNHDEDFMNNYRLFLNIHNIDTKDEEILQAYDTSARETFNSGKTPIDQL
jgi:hypothetical protein